jgi:hypothetical protein
MNSSGYDYKKLYRLQDNFLSWWKDQKYPLYLTGGTALGRFYLHHRASDDLDFFSNADPDFGGHVTDLFKKVDRVFRIEKEQTVITEDFARFFIVEDGLSLKIDMVNDVPYYYGEPSEYKYGLIDTPVNILANKLTALCSRDEPKDMFDIVHLALNFSFNWQVIFYHSKQKAIINEIDVMQRMHGFPGELFVNVKWIPGPIDIDTISGQIHLISNDFLLGKDNSLGSGKGSIFTVVLA